MLTPATELKPATRVGQADEGNASKGKVRALLVIGLVWAGLAMPNWLKSPTRSLAV